jgi:hypothetical protein
MSAPNGLRQFHRRQIRFQVAMNFLCRTPTLHRHLMTITICQHLNRCSTWFSNASVLVFQEFRLYLRETPIDIKGDPYAWWHENKTRFPVLHSAAIKYLSTPPSSVASEQFFSAVSDIYSDKKRNRLEPKIAKKLLFLNKNIPLIDYKYNFRKLNDTTEIADASEEDLFSDDSQLNTSDTE